MLAVSLFKAFSCSDKSDPEAYTGGSAARFPDGVAFCDPNLFLCVSSISPKRPSFLTSLTVSSFDNKGTDFGRVITALAYFGIGILEGLPRYHDSS